MAIEQQHQCCSSQMETFKSDSYRRQCQKCLLDRQISSGLLNHTLILTEMFLCNNRRKKCPENKISVLIPSLLHLVQLLRLPELAKRPGLNPLVLNFPCWYLEPHQDLGLGYKKWNEKPAKQESSLVLLCKTPKQPSLNAGNW